MANTTKRSNDPPWKYKQSDPVRHCPVYLDTANGSCVHVDGFLCDFPNCSIIKKVENESSRNV